MDTKDESSVNESSSSYKKEKRIYISTLQEQEENNYKRWLSFTPEQRINEVFEMQRRWYGEDIVSTPRKIGSRIVFDQK